MTEHHLQQMCRENRRRTGILLSVISILLNLLLFTLKYTGGKLSGSVAITADGFNNLADTGSCILTLSGFLLGCKRPTSRYPMGYGRLEYLSGLLISGAILTIGCRMLLCSAGKILHPASVEGCPAVIVILLISILVKGTMYLYHHIIGKRLNSSAMRAAALDSLCDCFATLAILAAMPIEQLTGFHADGWTGILVAVCILYAGVSSVKESVEPLLGKGIDPETADRLRQLIARHREVRAVSALLLHDYGPDKKLLTFSVAAEHPVRTIAALQKEIGERFRIAVLISPMSDKIPIKENNHQEKCPQYRQKKEIPERESHEHQTR